MVESVESVESTEENTEKLTQEIKSDQAETKQMTKDMTKAQLKCKICNSKRELTEEEIKESIEIVIRHNMKPNGILNIWSALDGEICPESGNHDYMWNPAFREYIMNEADKRKNNEVEIVRNNNENEELKNDYDKLKKETNAEVEKIRQEAEQKIKEITEKPYNKLKEIEDKLKKNQETNLKLEELNPELETNILKTSGREWKQWL